MKLHPEAIHHARRAVNYLAEAYDLDDEILVDSGVMRFEAVTDAALILNSPPHIGVRIRMERGGHHHVEAKYEEGPWLPVLHPLSQGQLRRIVEAVSHIDQDKYMGGPPPPTKEGD